MKARHILLALGAILLYSATLNAQGRDNRWDTGVSGNGALGQAITLAGGGSISVPPASAPTSVGSSDSSSSDSGSSYGGYSGGDYSGVGSALADGLIGSRGTTRFLGPGDDDARWDYADERVDGVHGLWYGIRGIGRGIGNAASWICDGIGSLFASKNFRTRNGIIDVGPAWDRSRYEVWGRRGKGYGIRCDKKWVVRPFYDNIRLLALRGAVAKTRGYWGMIDPTDGKTLQDFEFVYDKYSGVYYPDGPAYFVCAFGQTSPNGMENWILAIPDGEGGYYRSTEEYRKIDVFVDEARYVRAICVDHNGKYSMRGGAGKEILPAEFSSIKYTGFSYGDDPSSVQNPYYVSHYECVNQDGIGIYDSEGQCVVPTMFDKVDSMKQYGYLCHRVDNGKDDMYLIDNEGEVIVSNAQKITYDSVWLDYKTRIFLTVQNSDGKYAYFNTLGQQLTPFVSSTSQLPDKYDLKPEDLEEYRIY